MEADGSPLPGDEATVTSVLWSAAIPDRPWTIVGPKGESETRPHGDLFAEAESWASGLTDRGVSRGQRVALISETSFAFIVGCLAVWRAGAVVVPLPPLVRRASRASWAQTVTARLQGAGVSLLIGSDDELEGELSVPVLDPRSLPTSGATSPPVAISPNDEALIQFSSGSTKDPKGIVFTHGRLVSRLSRYQPSARTEASLACTPLHFGGLSSSIMKPIVNGRAAVVLHPERILRDPESWLLALSEAGITHAGAPNFVFAIATRSIEKGLSRSVDLSRLEEVLCTYGEATDLETITRFVEAARPLGFRPESLTTAYASTEAGMVSTSMPGTGLRVESVDRQALVRGKAVTTDGDFAARLVSSGSLQDGVSVRVVTPEGTDLPDRRIGELLLRTPWMMNGYLDDPSANDAAFVDGWFKSGDLGFMVDGELFVTGRSKDVIIVNGRNFYSADLEGIVGAAISEVERCAAVAVRSGTSEAAVLVVETKVVDAAAAEDLRRRVAREIWNSSGLAPKEIALVPAGSLPVTDAGKLRRAEIRRLYEAGALGGSTGP
jgi:acyl-CoA synthetase (AMP-forming)/AMP-acid ligase II